jgi:hypothetical protein
VPQEEILTDRLVLSARRVEFRRHSDLACVVQNDTDSHQVCVNMQMEFTSLFQQTISGFSHECDVTNQPRGSPELRE